LQLHRTACCILRVLDAFTAKLYVRLGHHQRDRNMEMGSFAFVLV
jgi:hypothetical protein